MEEGYFTQIYLHYVFYLNKIQAASVYSSTSYVGSLYAKLR